MTFITTASGRRMDFVNPDPDQVDELDIAIALGRAARFAGHTSRFYSVAEHCVNVSLVCEKRGEDPLWGLLHDAAEAYMCDLPGPLKRLLPGYSEIEHRVLRVIALKFKVGINSPFFGTVPIGVKQVDMELLCVEGKLLTRGDWPSIEKSELSDDEIKIIGLHCFKPDQAASLWIERLNLLQLLAVKP